VLSKLCMQTQSTPVTVTTSVTQTTLSAEAGLVASKFSALDTADGVTGVDGVVVVAVGEAAFDTGDVKVLDGLKVGNGGVTHVVPVALPDPSSSTMTNGNLGGSALYWASVASCSGVA